MKLIESIRLLNPSLTAENHCLSAKRPNGLGIDLAFRMRCLNRNNFALALMKYVNFDGFLITGQHSGTHWIKWMMSHAIAHHYGVPPPKYMNNSSSNELIGHPKHPRRYPDLPRIASSHSIPPYALQWKWVRRLRKPPPYAVVVRDVHDLLISNYEKWRESYAVPFSQYVAGDPRGKAYVCDVWWYVRFANRWGDVAQRHPLETLVLRYEDFRKYPLESLQRLCQHFGLELTEDDLTAGIAVGSKEIMARHQDPNIDEKPVRQDGRGATHFSREDLITLDSILRRHLRHDFGYSYFDEPRGFQVTGAQTNARGTGSRLGVRAPTGVALGRSKAR
jgi:Sulfotransferase domain